MKNFWLKIILFLGLGAVLSLAACVSSEHKKYYPESRVGKYQPGSSMPLLKTPPGLAPVPPDPYYDIPAAEPNSTIVTILPPGSVLLKQAQQQQKKKS